jgi:hypothetical protein
MQDLTSVIKIARTILSLHAACGLPIHYCTLARLLGLPPMVPNWSKHPLKTVFDRLDAEDARFGRPLRTCVVVKKKAESNAGCRPGNGFYRSLARARGVELRTGAQREAAYQAEIASARVRYAAGRAMRAAQGAGHATGAHLSLH